MTLEEAIGGAFGLSKYVRRGSWPQGSVAIVEVDPVVWTAYGVEEVKVVSVILR